jgi:hypothetical protein
MLFWDSSALAARYFGGPENAAIRRVLRENQTEGSAISSISLVTFSLLLRDLKAEGVPDPVLCQAGAAFHDDLPDFVQIEVDACLAMAGQMSLRHGLRLEPAIQLSAARHLEDRLEWNANPLPPPLVCMVTLDPLLAQAARAEGLAAAP